MRSESLGIEEAAETQDGIQYRLLFCTQVVQKWTIEGTF